MSMVELRFRRCSRLLKKAEYDRVFERAKKRSDRYFTVLTRYNSMLSPPRPRLGLVVGKKTAKSAVVRNRLKRLIRDSFRRQQSILPSVDAVVIARPAAAQENNALLLKSLSQHWQELAQR